MHLSILVHTSIHGFFNVGVPYSFMIKNSKIFANNFKMGVGGHCTKIFYLTYQISSFFYLAISILFIMLSTIKVNLFHQYPILSLLTVKNMILMYDLKKKRMEKLLLIPWLRLKSLL